MSIKSPVDSPVQSAVNFCLSDGGSYIAPNESKLVAWLKGPNSSNFIKLDSVNGYNFTFDTCVGVVYEADGITPVFEADGETLIYEADSSEVTWDCIYSAPASGDTGYSELLALDDGTLYDVNNNPIPLTRTALDDLNTDWIFFCHHTNKGIIIYDSLTPEELADVQEDFSCT